MSTQPLSGREFTAIREKKRRGERLSEEELQRYREEIYGTFRGMMQVHYWQHCKGGVYQLLGVALDYHTLEPHVLYVRMAEPAPRATWSMPLCDWVQEVEQRSKNGSDDIEHVMRFKPLERR